MYLDYAKNSGMELEQFISSQMGLDGEQFANMVEESAKSTVKLELILHSIRNAEGIEITQAGYDEFLADMLKETGYTEDTFKEKNKMTFAEYANQNNLFSSYLYKEVMNKVMEYSKGK